MEHAVLDTIMARVLTMEGVIPSFLYQMMSICHALPGDMEVAFIIWPLKSRILAQDIPVLIGMDQTEDNTSPYLGQFMGYMDSLEPELIILVFSSLTQPMVPTGTTRVLDFGIQFSPTDQPFQGCTKCASGMVLTLMPSSLPISQPLEHTIQQVAMVEVGELRVVSPWAQTKG